MDATHMQQIAELLAADLAIIPTLYTATVEQSPRKREIDELRARGIPVTHEPPILDFEHLAEGTDDSPMVSVHVGRVDDPRMHPIWIPMAGELAIAIRREGELIHMIEISPDPGHDLWNSLDQAQESVLEWEGGSWPPCPLAGHPHVVDLHEDEFRALWWRCPAEGKPVARFGHLAEAMPGG